MEALDKRIQALEAGAKFDATKEQVQRVEAECLLKLREIRAAMDNGGGGNGKELEALKKENEMLKKKNSQLEYRVKHVVREMDQMYEQLKATKQ